MHSSATPPPQWAPPPPSPQMHFPMLPHPPPQFPHHYAPPPYPQFAPPPPPLAAAASSPSSKSSEEKRTVWVGDLHVWMDENYLHGCFAHTGEVAFIKIIRNRQTGVSEGYGFVEFYTHATAEKILQSFTGVLMPNTDVPFRMNWASFSMGDRRSDASSDYSIFVGDLASDVTDSLLQETFSSKYPSAKGAKVVIDPNTGRSKGYGFVRFGDENEKTRAMSEMNGVYCSSRPMRIGAATPRKSSGGSSSTTTQGAQDDGDLSNTTVFVGGLDSSAREEDLRQAFATYGKITSIKIPLGKQCGFVQFVHRSNAEEAIEKLNGTIIGRQAIRLSWGRNPANRQVRADLSGQWNNAFYGGSFYGGYGYAFPPQNPAMYNAAAAYGGYPMYGNQQQVS